MQLISYFINLILSQTSATGRAEILRHLLSSALLSYSRYSNYEFVELISSVITKPYIFRLTDTFHFVHLTHSYEFKQLEEITSSGCRHLQKNLTRLSSGSVSDDSSADSSSSFAPDLVGVGINSPHIPFFGNYFKSLKRCSESTPVIGSFPPPSSPQHHHHHQEVKKGLINLVVLKFQNDIFLELERYQQIPYLFPISEVIQQRILFNNQFPTRSPEEILVALQSEDRNRVFGFSFVDEEKFQRRSEELEPNRSPVSYPPVRIEIGNELQSSGSYEYEEEEEEVEWEEEEEKYY